MKQCRIKAYKRMKVALSDSMLFGVASAEMLPCCNVEWQLGYIFQKFKINKMRLIYYIILYSELILMLCFVYYRQVLYSSKLLRITFWLSVACRLVSTPVKITKTQENNLIFKFEKKHCCMIQFLALSFIETWIG